MSRSDIIVTMKGWLFAVCALWLSSCVAPSQVECGGGIVCPAGTLCDEANGGCIMPEQLGCGGDGSTCIAGGRAGECRANVCLFPICGDGIATGSEQCDGADLRGNTCALFNAYEPNGTLACAPNCVWESSGCGSFCGDGVLDPANEECDFIAGMAAYAPEHDTCTDFEFYFDTGTLACTAQCTGNIDACTGKCGDGVVDFAHDELCDGSDPTTETCVSVGLDAGRLACNSFCSPALSSCVDFDWRAVDSTAGDPLDAWGSADDIFLALDSGNVRHFDGTAWSNMTLPTPNPTRLNAIWGTSSTNVYAAGHYGSTSTTAALFRFDGTTWTNYLPSIASSDTQLNAVWGYGNELFVGGMGGRMFHYTGSQWELQQVPPGYNVRGIWGTSATDVYAVGDTTETFFIAHYNGLAWTRVTNLPTCAGTGSQCTLKAISGTSPTNVIAVGANSVALHFNGADWSALAVPPGPDSVNETLVDIWALGPSGVLVVGDTDTQAHFDGLAWRSLESADTLFARSVWAGDLTNIIVGSALDTTYAWTGTRWVITPQPDGAVVPAADTIVGFSRNDIWTFGERVPQIAHFDGTTWSTETSVEEYFTNAWAFAPDDIYAIGKANATTTIVIHCDGTLSAGSRCAAVQGSSGLPLADLYGIWGINGEIVVVGERGLDGVIARYAAGTWSHITVTGVRLRGVWGTAVNDVWAAGTGMNGLGVLMHYNGVSWSQLPDAFLAQKPLKALGGVSSGGTTTLFAMTNGDLLRYVNGTWSLLPNQGPVPNGFTGRVVVFSPTDVFMVARTAVGSDLAHYDGTMVTPVRLPQDGIAGISGGPQRLFVGGSSVQELLRASPW